MRLVYTLQEESTSDDEDEGASDSDDSISSRRPNRQSRRIRSGKQRMSIVTNKLINVPRLDEDDRGHWDYGCGHIPEPATVPAKSTRRRFFQSSARWDESLRRVMVTNEGSRAPRISVADLMERGGRDDHDTSDVEDEMDIDEEEGEN